ncbi:hypothetical protein N7486_002763 [Penicillium sp. IBT 16267x]|nr:hypothetical protein N7486_002763 [Penicillium sp. IBT 16267x]
MDDIDGLTTVNNTTYYNNVFTFRDRLKELIRLKSERFVRAHIHPCLKGATLRLYSNELTDCEK